MTRISLLAIKVDSQPNDIRLSAEDHGLILRLAPGVHLDLSDTSEESLRVMAQQLMTAARIKAARQLPAVA
ncbi:hypothetical protein [Streptomyces ziwulingensis]|uniref:Uncharacterized protein n=1 Tax=Streptomyces ziwulingensis TaxID=1045501 RepID=A0ABP9CZX2_9ACTN